MFVLSSKSLGRLAGVHPDLQRVVRRAIELTTCDFAVLEGLRTKGRQELLVKAGSSKTMNSRHLTGHAVDLVAYINGATSWEWQYYHKIAAAMKAASAELRVPIEWGGDWKTFKDGLHFQLPHKEYPA